MKQDLAAAVERLMRVGSGEQLAEVYQAENETHSTPHGPVTFVANRALTGFLDDQKAAIRAYLALLDPTPLTAEVMRAEGWMVEASERSDQWQASKWFRGLEVKLWNDGDVLMSQANGKIQWHTIKWPCPVRTLGHLRRIVADLEGKNETT